MSAHYQKKKKKKKKSQGLAANAQNAGNMGFLTQWRNEGAAILANRDEGFWPARGRGRQDPTFYHCFNNSAALHPT